MKKAKIAKFILGLLAFALLGTVIAMVKVSLFDCKYGVCFSRVCVDTDKECEGNNINGEYDCCFYDTRKTPFNDYLFDQIKFFSLSLSLGLGIFLSALWVEKSKNGMIERFFNWISQKNKERQRKSFEKEQIKKIQSAKTGKPIELTGYGIIDPEGNDTGRRFIRKEDAEKYLNKFKQDNKK